MRHYEIYKVKTIIDPEYKYKVPTFNDIRKKEQKIILTYALVLRIVLINVGNGDMRGVRDVVGGARLASLSFAFLL